MHNLAVMSADTANGKPDLASAAKWFGAAANHGLPDSQFNFAVLNERGLGVRGHTSTEMGEAAEPAPPGKDLAHEHRGVPALVRITRGGYSAGAAAISSSNCSVRRVRASPAAWKS